MKRIFTIFLTLFVASSVWAATFEVDGMYYYTISENEVEVANHLWDEDYYYGDIVIPSSVTYGGNNYNVTSIETEAFVNCTGLTSITIPESVTTIGDNAFRSCFGLTSITILSSVISIGTDAFEYCSGLTSITIPDGLDVSDARIYFTKNDKKYQVKNSKEVAVTGYDYYESIKYTGDIIIPSTVTAGNTYSVTSIEERAFYECLDLTSVTIPNSVTSIGDYAFSGCKSLTSITIPNSVTSIGKDAFRRVPCVIYSGSAEGSGWGAYEVYGAKDDNFYYKDAEKTIIFRYIGNGGDVAIPNRVTAIEEDAFGIYYEDRSIITSITIPNGLDVSNAGISFVKDGIHYNVINNNEVSVGYAESSLTDINIPSAITAGNTFTVTSIDDYAFSGYTISSIIVPDNVDISNASIRIEKDGIYYNVISNDEVSVDRAESSLTEVNIPNMITAGMTFAVTEIEEYAFSDCSNLKSVSIPSGVTKVEEGAFSGCTLLKDVTCLAAVPPTAYANSFENYNGYLYIPCESADDYDFASCWGSFKHVECIGAETVELTKDEVSVVPEKTEAVFSMPKNESANTYTLTISNNGVTFCTLTFNAQGQLANIDFSITKSYELKSDVEGFKFTVTGLSTAEDYGYSFKALASNKSVLKEYSGSFTTKNEDGTGGSSQGGEEVGGGSGEGGQGGETETKFTVTLSPNNNAYGSVMGGGEYAEGATATIAAIPASDYKFVQWNDGNTDNPRTITVTESCIYVATFEKISTAINDVVADFAITISNRQILINGEAPAFVITVSGQKIANQNLKAGVYFVNVEGETVKVAVK